ncbi:MAG: hypothetical protein IKW10_05185 [Oscillospiraceae bacterium]|nr:hypothetical protein [Oscillospiraceae bacterium]
MKKKLICMLLMLALVVGVTVIGVSADETAAHTDHCVCGGKVTVGDHVCDETNPTWTAWTGTETDGYYYLTDNITVSKPISIAKGSTLTLCLNGKTLASTTSESAFTIRGELNICDCQGGGKITAKSKKAPGMIKMVNSDADATLGTVFNLYGGDLVMIDNDYSANAGVVQVGNSGNNPAKFNMYDGSISGGTANKGGNIIIQTPNAVMNMYGGSVTGGKVWSDDTKASNALNRNKGGNIYVNDGQLNVYGGTISGGTVAQDVYHAGLGGDIFQIKGRVYLNTNLGTLDYANNTADYFLTLGEKFSAQNVICNSVAGVPVKVAEGNEAQAKAFSSAVEGCYVAYENGELIMKMIPVETISLRYDDRKDLNTLVGAAEGAEVSISNEVVTSTGDSHVLVYENGLLIATGTGTAKLTVDGTSYEVTVSPAPISLFMITGHSVGRGEKGNGAQSVAMEAGQAYSTHRYHTYEATGSAAIIDPNEVTETTGLGYGAANRLSGIDAFAAGQGGNEGEGSALAWQWNQLTGEKVWVINAAVGGSCLNEWIPGAEGHNTTYKNHFETSLAAFQAAEAILNREIAAGHYTLSHTAIIYHSAANFNQFEGWTQELIEEYYNQMWNGYKDALDVEALGLVPIWTASGRNDLWNDKPANYFMAASNEYPDVFMASLITREWMISTGLKDFPDITYATQSAAVSKPTSVQHKDQGGSSTNSVFCSADKTHLTQVVYNAQGIEIANNMFGYFEGDKTVSSVELRTDRNVLLGDALELQVGENVYANIVTDKVYANDLTITVEGNINVEFPMHIVATEEGSGTITISQGDKVLKTLSVTVKAAHSHCICGGHVEGHACQDVTWTAWGDDYDETYSLPTTAGYYYLTKDMSFTSEFNIGENTEIFLCLNGYNITNTDGSKRIYNIYGKLNICDCAEEENWGTISTKLCDEEGTKVAGVFQLRDNKKDKTATLNLYSGIIASGAEYALKQGGLIQLGNADTYGAVFNMYGGKLIGGNVTTNGGAVYVMSKSQFNIFGGTIEGGTAGERGGNIYTEGALNISGGTITGGIAKNGGNIYMNTGAVVSITGGEISNGTANQENGFGGNIRVNAGQLTLSGVTMTGGTAKFGGSIAVQGTALIENATLQTNTEGRGRVIYVDKAGVLTLKDSNIENQTESGTTIWVLGKVILQGTVNIPSVNPEVPTLDILLDKQTKGAAQIDASGLTGQDEPFSIRRWEIDEDDDDPGLAVVGATEDMLSMFFARRAGYTVTYADGNIYLSNCNIQGMKGNAVYSGFATLDEAMADTHEKVAYYRINADLNGGTITRDVIIDLNGNHLTNVTVNEGVTVSLADSANDNYDAAACGSLSGTVNGTITAIFRADGTNLGGVKPYVAVYEDGKYSAHRYSVTLTAVSLDPNNDALGYKATFKTDDVLKNYVAGYGFDLWVNDGAAKTYSAKDAFEPGVRSLRLKNILANNGGEMTIHAEAFIIFNTIDGEQETRKSAAHATTMKAAIEAVNEAYAADNTVYTDAQMQAVQALCKQYESVMTEWNIASILAWAPAPEEV